MAQTTQMAIMPSEMHSPFGTVEAISYRYLAAFTIHTYKYWRLLATFQSASREITFPNVLLIMYKYCQIYSPFRGTL